MAKQEQTSRRVATLAGSILADPKASKKDKQLAESALSQAESKRRNAR
jgi:hypothetical protein